MRKWPRIAANIFFLTISCFLIAYFLVQLTENFYIRCGIIVFAVSLDIYMQYVLALGRLRWNTQHRVIACWLFFCYAIYIVLYAVPSATSFFSVEIDTMDTAYNDVTYQNTQIKNRISQIDKEIDSWNKHLDFEGNSGYGSRSKAVDDKLQQLNQERNKLLASQKVTSSQLEKMPKSGFKVLHQLTGFNENLLKITIFSVSVFMLYLGLIMTSWDLQQKSEVAKESEKVQTELSESVPNDSEYVRFAKHVLVDGNKKLKGTDSVSKLTGIPRERCENYLKQLNELMIDGIAAVKTGIGGSVANFPRETILKNLEG